MSIIVDGSTNEITVNGSVTTGTGGLVRKTGAVINPTSIGATTPGTGAFTTLSASGTVSTSAGSNGVYLNGTPSNTLATGNACRFGTNFVIQENASPVQLDFRSYNGAAWDTRGYFSQAGVLNLLNGLAVTGAISSTATIKTGGYTVATLPAGTTGDRAYVTNATAPTYLGALTGGGAVVCPVFKNATAWVSA